jgi:hypothetical protein
VTRFHGHKKFPILIFPFIMAGLAAAAPDPRLLSLVPPGAHLVAGISASVRDGQPQNFVLITPNNWADLQDFFALTGADETRVIHQVVFVAVADEDGQPKEHSLLVSGQFDQSHIFKSAAAGGAALSTYRGIPVLEIQPFTRERGKFNDVRWLAVLDSSVVVFGTAASTQLELDRHLSRSRPDGSLLRRLGRLRSKDQTWCLLRISSRALSVLTGNQEIHNALTELNPELAELAQSAKELGFGMYYGRKVEFEYEVALDKTATGPFGPDSFRQSPAKPPGSASLLPALNATGDANSRHGLIAISISRYKAWLSEVSARGSDQRTAMTRSPE